MTQENPDTQIKDDLLKSAGHALDHSAGAFLLADSGQPPKASADQPGLYFDVEFVGQLVEYRVGQECAMCDEPTTARGHGKYCDGCAADELPA